MKILRFIRNVSVSIWETATDTDAKEFGSVVWDNVKVMTALFTLLYILGLIGKWIGLMKYLPKDKQDSIFGLGAILFAAIFMIGMLLICVFAAFLNLEKIWKKS